MGDLARILIYGDIHLSSKNYGAHVDYPRETLYYFRLITQKAEEYKATHIIGLGDFTYGRFHSLEYRYAVEKELEKQNEITEGRRYELKGNHDIAPYGMTEYEYYVTKGLLKPSTNLKIGNVNISMVDYQKHNTWEIIDPSNNDEINVVLAHGYFKFKDTKLPNYGTAVELDHFVRWYGVDYLICGHIHNHHMFDGLIIKDNIGHRMVVHYLGSMSRPAYREGFMDEDGHLVILTIRDNGEMQYDIDEIKLWPLEKSFNLSKKEEAKKIMGGNEVTVDISDIVNRLNTHERNIGNPEDIIEAMEGIDPRYKKKAIELLKAGRG